MGDIIVGTFFVLILMALVTGILTGAKYINEDKNIMIICGEIQWNSETCKKLKPQYYKE